MPLRPSELEMHFSQELEYLTKLSAAISANHRNVQQQQQGFKSPNSVDGSPFHPGAKAMSPRNPMEVAPRSRWDVSTEISRQIIRH